MARSDPQVNIRMPAELKTLLEDRAMTAKRSLNTEIVSRLDASLNSSLASERDKFIADNSHKLLGDIIGSAVSNGETPNIPSCVDIAVKAAAALFDRLSEDGHL